MLRPEDLAHLGHWLRQHRYSVSPTQLREVARMLVDDPRAPRTALTLAPWLAPVFCTSAKEQREFGALYREWLQLRGLLPRDEAPPAPAPPALPRRRWPWHTGIAGVLLVVLVGVLTGATVLALSQWDERELPVRVIGADSMVGSAPLSVNERPIGTTDRYGEARLRYRRSELPLVVAVEHPTEVDADGRPLRDRQRLERPHEAPMTLRLAPQELAAKLPPPPADARLVRSVPAPDDVRGDPVFSDQPRPDWPRLALLLTAASAPLLGWAIERLRRRGFLERLPSDDDSTSEHLRAEREQLLVALRRELRVLGRELRRRIVVSSRELDVAATLKATLRRGGLAQPVFGTRLEPEHLVLIDRASHGDHAARLADEAVRDLHQQGLQIERYLFDGDLRRCWHAPIEGPVAHVGPQTLDRLAGRHAGARLLLFSDGRGLVDGLSGRVVPALQALLGWDRPLLLTPQPRACWGLREWQLERAGLTVLPLDAEGLLLVGRILASDLPAPMLAAERRVHERAVYQRDVDLLLDREAPDAAFVERIVSVLQAEHETDPLEPNQADPVSFAWLCALAVYPELHWGITLAVGDAVTQALEPGSDDPRKRAARLTRLSRLPWLRHGHMPDWLRDALLDRLPPAAEEAVRDRLSQFLASLSPAKQEINDADGVSIARDPSDHTPWRDALRGLRRMFSPLPPPSAGDDRVFLRFMDGRPRRRTVTAGERLRALMYHDGVPLVGPRLLLPVLFIGLTLAAAQVWPPSYAETVEQIGPPVPVRPLALALDVEGRYLAISDDAGGARIVRTADAQPVWAMAASGSALAARRELLQRERPFVARWPDDRWVAPEATAAMRLHSVVWPTRPGEASPVADDAVASAWTPSAPAGAFALESRVGSPIAAGDAEICRVVDPVNRRVVRLTREFLRRTLYGGAPTTPTACAASASAAMLAVLDDGGGLVLTPLQRPDAARGARAAQRVATLEGAPSAVTVSDDGRTVAVLRADGQVAVLRGVSRVVALLDGGLPGLAIALSGSGEVLALSRPDRLVQVWNLTPGDGRQELIAISESPFASQATVSRVLEQRYGFRSTLLREGSRADLRRVLKVAVEQLEEPDRLVLHLDVPVVAGRFVLYDGRELALAEVASFLSEVRAREVLVFLGQVADGDLRTGKASTRAGLTRVVLRAQDGTIAPGTGFGPALAHVLASAPEGRAIAARDLAPLLGGTTAWREWPAAGHEAGDFLLTPRGPAVNVIAAMPLPPPTRPASSPSVAEGSGDWEPYAELRQDDPVDVVAFSPDGRLVVAAGRDTVRTIDVASRRQLSGVTQGASAVTFAPDGRSVYTSHGAEIVVRDPTSLKPLRSFSRSRVRALATSPPGSHLAMGRVQGSVHVIDVESGREVFSRVIGGVTDADVLSIAFSRDARRLVALTNSGDLFQWDLTTGEERRARAHNEPTKSLAVSPDGRSIATTSFDGRIRLWRMDDLAPVLSVRDAAEGLSTISFDPSGTLLLTGGMERVLRLWDARTGLPRGDGIRGAGGAKGLVEPGWINSAAFSPDGRFIASADDDKRVRIWRRRQETSALPVAGAVK